MRQSLIFPEMKLFVFLISSVLRKLMHIDWLAHKFKYEVTIDPALDFKQPPEETSKSDLYRKVTFEYRFVFP